MMNNRHKRFSLCSPHGGGGSIGDHWRLDSRLRGNDGERGAALIFALTLLALFAVLGTSYVVGMSLRVDEAALTIRGTRAEHLAEAGVHAAVGELAKAMAEGRTAELLAKGEMDFQFGAYEGVMTEAGYILEQAPRNSHAVVRISDESGKLNINHAPASMLRLLLNIDGATARNITASLPLPRLFEAQAAADKRWLAGADELVSRGFLSQQQLDAVDTSVLTAYTVADHAKPERFLNVNAAPAPVLAALFDVPIEQAEAAMEKRPFQGLADLEAASGKKAFTFNIKPDPGARDELPPELALESRSFRIESMGTYGIEGQGMARRSTARAEAVVVFDGEGNYTITHWSADAGMEEREVAEAPAPAAPEMAEAKGEDEGAKAPAEDNATAPADASAQ